MQHFTVVNGSHSDKSAEIAQSSIDIMSVKKTVCCFISLAAPVLKA